MKNRFTALDVAAAVSNIEANGVGMRASNIYGINGKTYMIKLHAANQDKRFLLLESGIRVHSTKYMRDKPKIPSVFTLKLRKHIRNKRLESVRQLGLDRVIDFTFGREEASYHLIIELHSKGNVLLTDHEYNIITLLRTYKYKDTGVLIATKQKYPVDDAQQFTRATKEEVKELLENGDRTATLKQVLSRRFEFSPALVQHAVLKAGLNPNHKLNKWDSSNLDRLFEELAKAEEVVIKTRVESSKGWVISRDTKEDVEAVKAKAAALAAAAVSEGDSKVDEEPKVAYDSFVPFLYCQFENRHVIEFDTFDEATDEFFSKTEAQKVDIQRTAQEGVVDKKLAKVKADQTKRIVALEKKEEDCLVQAQLIQENLDDVEKALMIIRSAIANSMDWTDLAKIIKEEKKNGDPIAQLIHKLNLERGGITLLLSGKEDDETDEDQTLPAKLVDLDINLSAYANMERYYAEKKASAAKKKKTKAVVNKAMKRAEKKVRKDVQVVQVKKGIQRLRKPFWFEKFYWFLSSEGYVVVSGRDAQQNEMIVKRYLSKGDLYVHADLHGAASVVIKNPTGKAIPPSTLEQAGAFAICRSAAWNAKIITSAWWVYPHQVSKTAPSGEYLTTGSFVIRGKKNFLPPVQLLMGFAVLFRVDDACIERHLAEKKLQEIEGIPSVVDESEMALNDGTAEASVAVDGEKNVTEETSTKGSETESSALKSSDCVAESVETTVASPESDVGTLGDSKTETEKEEEDNEECETADAVGDDVDDDGDDDEESEESEEEFQPRYAGIAEKYQVEQKEAHSEKIQEKIERKPRMSAKQRRLLKKGLDPNDPEILQEIEERKQQLLQQQKKSKVKKTGKGRRAHAQPKVTVPRGKKKKMKKIKTKYADQDEEERRLRMQILASAGPQKDAEDSEVQEEDAGSGDEIASDSAPSTATKPKTRKDRTPEEIEEEQRRREEEALASAKEAMENTSFLDALTGSPHPEDILVAAIPVCAPYAAVQRYKYRVKLTPGNSKTGAACKAALSAFNKVKEMTDQERSAMKAMSDNEMHQQMIANARVQSAAPK